MAWGPHGQLASGSDDNTVRVWDASSGECVRVLDGHQNRVRSVAWGPGGQLASGSFDNTVRVWEASGGECLRVLEGYESLVSSLLWVADGRWLASASNSDFILWDCASWQPAYQGRSPGFRWIVPELFLSSDALGEHSFGGLRIVSVAVDTPTESKVASALRSAKVVLVGESNVGKSCLAQQLAEGKYDPSGTTLGMKIWSLPPEKLDPAAKAPANEKREIFLWDFGGQDEFRLVHQLFLRDTRTALFLADITRGETAFEDMEEWNRRLARQTQGQDVRKLLIRPKTDERPDWKVDHLRIDQLKQSCGFRAYHEVSAAKPEIGIAELKKALSEAIGWAEIPPVTQLRVFQRLYEIVTEHRQAGHTYTSVREVAARLEKELGTEYDSRGLDAAIAQMSTQGLLVAFELNVSERVLLLRVEEVNKYAGAIIRAAQTNVRGFPAVEEKVILSGGAALDSMPAHERLDLENERLVLSCAVQLLIHHGLCLRSQGLLVFPSEVRSPRKDIPEEFGDPLSLYFDYTGPVTDAYTTLVAHLARGKQFGDLYLWDNWAEFRHGDGGACAVVKEDLKGGRGHFKILFSRECVQERRPLFAAVVREHLVKEGLTVLRKYSFKCEKGYTFDSKVIEEVLREGHRDIPCPLCRVNHPLPAGDDLERQLGERDVRKEARETREDKEAVAVTKEEGDYDVFLGHRPEDKDTVRRLAIRLSDAGLRVWFDEWEIKPGDHILLKIEEGLKRSRVLAACFSRRSLASRWTDLESQSALFRDPANAQRRFVPILLDDVTLPDMWRTVTYVDWRKPSKDSVSELVNFCRPASVLERFTLTLQSKKEDPPLHILHLSDLHLRKEDTVNELLSPLAQDVRQVLAGNALDYLVVSGDLSDRGNAEGFDRAVAFLSAVITEFKLTAERLVLVPGNHDVDWTVKTHDLMDEFELRQRGLDPKDHVATGGGVYRVVRGDDYPKRFERFRRAFHLLHASSIDYPLDPTEQFRDILFEKSRVQFLALNSAWEIDRFEPKRCSICLEALGRGLRRADEVVERARHDRRMAEGPLLRIAVWHHAVTGTDAMHETAFLGQLSRAGFALCMHGDVHETRDDVYRPFREGIYAVGAGALHASADQRPESTPRLYNILEIPRDFSRIRVNVRCQDHRGGPFEEYAKWPPPKGPGRVGWFEIQKPRVWG